VVKQRSLGGRGAGGHVRGNKVGRAWIRLQPFCFLCMDLGKIKGKGFKPFINRLKLFIKGFFWGHEIQLRSM
jgi:hypothetical protein